MEIDLCFYVYGNFIVFRFVVLGECVIGECVNEYR